MDKQDLIYVIVALALILIVALVIKPMVTGQAINTGIPTPTPTPDPAIEATPDPALKPQIRPTTIATPVPTATPTPVVTWDKNVTSVVFVDPSLYGISLNQSLPGGTRIDNIPLNTSMTTFATINGRYSGTSQIINVPFPYWELWYTVEPSGATSGKGQTLSSSTVSGPKQSGIKSSGSSQTVIQGSYSVTIPTFTVQVMDGNDPNRIVRSITPPGGIDKDLWIGKSVTGEYSGDLTIPDPRPWKEKFFEGERSYFFIINSQSLDSYTIELKVPTKYTESK
jgi:hypothetical protein